MKIIQNSLIAIGLVSLNIFTGEAHALTELDCPQYLKMNDPKIIYKNGLKFIEMIPNEIRYINQEKFDICRKLAIDGINTSSSQEISLDVVEAEYQRIQEKKAADIRAYQEKQEASRRAMAERTRIMQEEIIKKRANEEAIKSSPEYKKREAELAIQRGEGELARLNKYLDEEKRIGEVSGYIDKIRMHEIGAQIIYIGDFIKEKKKLISEINYKKLKPAP